MMLSNSYAKVIWEDFVSLIFPRTCIGCDEILIRNEEIICSKCFLDLPITNYHKIPDNPIKRKFAWNKRIVHAFSFLTFQKEGIAQKLLHELKYQGNYEVGLKIGEWFGNLVNKQIEGYELIIPVPIHEFKEKKRGYNQSEAIARGISNVTGIPVEDKHISRIVNTETQTSKSRIERWENVSKVFRMQNPSPIVGKSIIVVDDVITTGATIGELCDELEEIGVNRIAVLALASGK